MAILEMHNNEYYAAHALTTLWPELESKLEDIYFISCKTSDGLLHKSHEWLADQVTQIAATGKKYFIFDNSAEAVHIPVIRHINEVYSLCNNPALHFYYWTGSVSGQEDYDRLCNAYCLEKNINILSSNFFEEIASREIVYSKPYVPGLREKKFLCYNRVERQHRVDLLVHMLNLDIVKDSYYSFDFTSANSPRFLRGEKYKLLLDSVPLTINRSPTETNPVQIWAEDFQYFEKSYISIVTETMFYEQLLAPPGYMLHTPSTVRGVFPSEKIYKPIAMRHPFILVSSPNFLQALRDRGYKTFSPLIDESYDTIDDDNERMLAIVNEIERLSKYTDVEWQEFTNSVKDIVEHNARHLFSLTDFRVTKDIDSMFK